MQTTTHNRLASFVFVCFGCFESASVFATDLVLGLSAFDFFQYQAQRGITFASASLSLNMRAIEFQLFQM
jgi:hypothetical protein